MIIINSKIIKKQTATPFSSLSPVVVNYKALSNIRAFCFKPDGTELYCAVQNSNTIYQYSLSEAWNVTTAVYNKSFSSSISPTCIAISSDGLNLYLSRDSGILQHTLSQAWDISTASYSQTSSNNALARFLFTQDGSIVYGIANNKYDVMKYTLSTSWDISTMSYVNKQSLAQYYEAIRISSDGYKFYVGYNNLIKEYYLTTPYDITTASLLKAQFDKSFITPNALEDFCFSTDGLYLFFTGMGIDVVYKVKLSP